VLWDNVPVQQRTLDTEHRLEQLLEAFGSELEAFLGQIALLPAQRDPYQARASEGQEEWFYATSALRWTDENWGDVLRLVGEPDFAAMPNTGNTLLTFAAGGYVDCIPADLGVSVIGTMSGHGGTLVSYDNATRTWWVRRDTDTDLFDIMEGVRVVDGVGHGTLAAAAPLPWPSAYLTDPDRYPWYPYEPIGDVARWWKVQIPTVNDVTGAEEVVELEVAQARTRNFDQTLIYNPTLSLGNEVWVRGGDLVLPFMRPAGWIIDPLPTADNTAGKVGVPIGLGDGTQAPTVVLPGPRQRLQYNISPQPTFPIMVDFLCNAARLVIDVPLQGGGTLRLYDLPTLLFPTGGDADVGALHREDPLNPGFLEWANPMGSVDYLAGTVSIDFGLNALGYFSLFDGPIAAFWQARGYYLPFRPPRTIDELARDYGFENDRNDPEDRQRAAIAHLWQYFGCKGAQDAYRIRGEISLFNVNVSALWHLCSADLAMTLPSDHVWMYGADYYTDLDPRSIRFDDIRADEQYYDTFDHDPLFPSPAWLTLADRAQMFLDDGELDGMSAALAFGLDVTQGYYAPVSETDATPRTAVDVISVDPLLPAEAAAFGLPAGYRVTLEMMRCQAEAFHFKKGAFGLTVYDPGVTPPAFTDTVYWIDIEESVWTRTSNNWAATTAYALGDHVYSSVGDGYECTWAGISGVGEPVWDTGIGATTADGAVIWTRVVKPALADRDVGRWTVIIGTGVGATIFSPGDHVAVRYYPEVDHGDCCYCRSYKVRVEIEPMAQAYTYYETEDAMLAAVERLKTKILAQLIPIHARVAEWVVTTEFSFTMGGVQTGWVDTRVMDPDEWVDMGPSARVELTIEQRGDLGGFFGQQMLTIQDGGGVPLVGPLAAPLVGFVDLVNWHPVVTVGPIVWTNRDVTADLNGVVGTSVIAASAPVSAAGDVRWTFRVTRSTLP
jgi:hypothetical protein